jgi:hypothetical protein
MSTLLLIYSHSSIIFYNLYKNDFRGWWRTHPGNSRGSAYQGEFLQLFPLQEVICCFRRPVQSHANTFLNSKEALWLSSVLKIDFPIKKLK